MINNSKGLTKNQKEAVALLSIGTFLEYFDLMLYIHMAVLLNELFFPQDNPAATQLLTTFTFCSTFLLRPLGGFIIGWIGDQFGRKVTIMLTTTLMAATCVTMAIIGTYAEIGITATVVVILCRALQGISTLGEGLGAMIYLAESLKRPYNYITSGMIEISSTIGTLVALSVTLLVTSGYFDWRIAFWIGAIIAIIGIAARTRLRETPEFIEYQRRLKIKMEASNINLAVVKKVSAVKQKVDKKAVMAYFLIRLVTPTCFFTTYIWAIS
ncbi:MFS transporter N-terminal domain protein [Candidatus Bandiella woodruffii]|uniref:MFS transporter N-terminal domain protein n=2 Tax=Candidatus Bandiella euplotis TaxID=1664265 RepID=A0ABZ0ULG9_9RICK|nr:MFS transporter N-terminal domain protein [Candidatus Bandiella woodruffii]